jgi:hypothetical protein
VASRPERSRSGRDDPGDVRGLVRRHLADPESGWSMGAPGALAEFLRDPDEPTVLGPCSVATDRGGIRIDPPPGCVPLAYETPVGPQDRWNHAVAFCVPAGRARVAARTVITELGPDRRPLRAEDGPDGGAVLFDLGLGTPTVEACVRTAEPELLDLLRAACGQPLFAPGSPVAAALVAAGPHRVFRTACGRIEVYVAIPPPDGRSPDGPHTHLLPGILRTGRTHTAAVAVPAGHLPCAHLYPAHPLTDRTGRPRPFDPSRAAAFDDLLARYGDVEQARVTAEVVRAVRAGAGPESVATPTDAPGRAALAVALRKLSHTGTPPDQLARWRRSAPPGADLLDPDSDRNAG